MTMLGYVLRKDPETQEDGGMKIEYRTSLIGKFTPEELGNAWGPDWRKYAPQASHVLERRFTQKSKAGKWEPHQSANSFAQTLQYLPDDIISKNDSVIKLLQFRKNANQLNNEWREKGFEAKRLAKDRNATFVKMLTSKNAATAALAMKWNRYHQEVLSMGDDAKKAEMARIQKNADIFTAYQNAMNATRVPDKVREMKLFFKLAGI